MGLENIEGLNDVEILKKIGTKEGAPLELVLYKGTEFENISSPALIVGLRGFKQCNKMGKEKGIRLIGYIQEFDIQNNRIILSPTKVMDGTISSDYGRFYVDMECIYAIRYIP